jgi:hypothetical protein
VKINGKVVLIGSFYTVCLFTGGCSTKDAGPSGPIRGADLAMEVPVIPVEPPAEQKKPTVAEHAGTFGPGTAVLGGPALPLINSYPGEFAFRTQKGYYLTAINGGGRIADPIVVTSATAAGAWEKFAGYRDPTVCL